MKHIHCMSSNPHKLTEFNRILEPFGYNVIQSQNKKIEIQAEKLEEIVLYSLNQVLEDNCFVEDAGLFIKVLKGFPGPFSSFVNQTLGCDGLLKILKGNENRCASFISCIAFRNKFGEVELFRGEIEGEIALVKKGSGGFGFDPIFVPKGMNMTFSEMISSEKDKLSHRGRSTRALGTYLENIK